jgi:hyperosmotically inducible periplasmic protein
MKNVKWLACVAAVGLLAGCGEGSREDAGASDVEERNSGVVTGERTDGTSVDADNTGRNERDRSDAALTPGDQGGSEADREITRQIRRAITAEDRFSMTAKNVKIITIDGKVTLRGPVNSREEATAIEAIARQAGVSEVNNELEVKATSEQ